MGPFGIFQAEAASYKKLDSVTSDNDNNGDCDGRTDTNTPSSDRGSPNTVDLGCTLFGLSSNEEIIPHSSAEAMGPSDWTQLIPVFDPSKSSSTRKPNGTDPSPHFEISVPLFKDPNIFVLLYHYKNHVANLLQPVLHPRNPWRTTYFPIALEGCPDLILTQNAGPSSGVSLSLFHSLLSSAAFHLRNLMGGSPEYHKLGLQHRAKALQALSSGLAVTSSPKQYTVYLTAMLALVTIDVSDLCLILG
jgi:arginine metabolism regulation protein II